MSSEPPLVLVERAQSDVTVVTLNKPDRLNALSFALVEELHDVLDDIQRDNSCRVVILTGAGRGFCSGLDLVQYGGSPVSVGTSGPRASMLSQARIADLPTKIHRLQQPVIAAVNGVAVGGGFALALACDLRVADPTALFCSQFIRMGLGGCDIGVSYLLPRLIGASRAAELLLTSRNVDATEALRIGMVSACSDDVMAAAFDLAATMTSFGPFALPMTKEVYWSNVDAPSIESAIHLENRTQTLAATSGEVDDAVAAFLARRSRPATGVDEVDQ